MNFFYKVSDKELLEVRNKIFLEKGIPALKKNGFEQSPFPTAWFGKESADGYIYEVCRLSKNPYLEIVTTYINKGDRWIQVFLNIFNVQPKLNSLSDLKQSEGIKYDLPPNSKTNMRLRIDDIKGMPLLDYNFMFGRHKLQSYYTQSGFKQRVEQLGNRIQEDLNNIDDFVKRWHELYEPNLVDWEGNPRKIEN